METIVIYKKTKEQIREDFMTILAVVLERVAQFSIEEGEGNIELI